MERRSRFSRRRALLLLGLALLAVLLLVPRVRSEVRFLLRAASEEARILRARQPLAELAASPETPPARRERFELVLAARDFAAGDLGLDAKETYTTFSDVGRGNLLYVLTASRRDRLQDYRWWYPVVGSVPYKGFFLREEAVAEQRRLERAGYDTYLRTAGAFSTLGWFNDPLLSTVLDSDRTDLVSTVIHEISHNTLWVPGSVRFNESYANFVGLKGAEAFFARRGDPEAARIAAATWRDERRLGAFYARLARELEALYGSGATGAELEARRDGIFARARNELSGDFGRSLEVYPAKKLARRKLNNASVIAERIYRTGLDDLERVLLSQGGDLRAAVATIERSVRDAPPGRSPLEALAAAVTPGREGAATPPG
jgi:predicted aminopeptidase